MSMVDDNTDLILHNSTGETCMICFTDLYSIHELTCCKKIICTVCVTNWITKQPIKDNLCVFCKKPNYIFQHTYINLDEDKRVGCYSHVLTCLMIVTVFFFVVVVSILFLI